MVCAAACVGSIFKAARASAAAASRVPAAYFWPALATRCRARVRCRDASVSLNAYSGATRSPPRRCASGLTKVSREQPVSAMPTTAASNTPSRRRIDAPVRAVRFERLAELGLATGPVHDLPLQLAAGGVDVVAACATHRRDAPGLIEQLLESADG